MFRKPVITGMLMLFAVSVLLFPILASSETITVTQGSNGTISPGTIWVDVGTSQTFIIRPTCDHTIQDVIVDDVNSSITSPWTDYGTQTGNNQIRNLTYLGDGTVIAVGSNIIRSTDYGITWTETNAVWEGGFKLNVIYAGDGVVLAGTAWGGGKILRSVDYGLTWNAVELSQDKGITHIYGLESLGNGVVLAGTTEMICCYSLNFAMILRSTDYGETWEEVLGLKQDLNFTTIEYLGNGIVVAGTAGPTGSIWRSTDYGFTWTNLGSQGGERDFDYITHLGKGIAIASTYPNGKMLRSTDYGLTWTDLGKFDEDKFMSQVASAGNGIAVAGTGSDGHIWRTTDYGATWTDLGQQGGEKNIQPVYIENGIFLAGTRPTGKILRSTDYGLGAVTTYTFTDIQEDHSLTASFIPVKYCEDDDCDYEDDEDDEDDED